MGLSLEDRGVQVCLGVAATGVACGVYAYFKHFRVQGKVETESQRHGGELVMKVLKEQGVKFVFTLVGGHISPILVSCEKNGIRVVDTRHEVTAVFAADAVARMSGVPGVAAVTAGPGLTNTITAVKNAQMAESPLVLIGGAAATLLKGRGALQDIDQMALFKPLCKYCVTVTRVRDIVPLLRRAFYEAQSGTPGPVFVEFPIDTLYPYPMVLREIGADGVDPKKKPSLMQSVVKWYLTNHINRQFAGAWDEQDCSPIPPSIPTASIATVTKAADILRNAKKPIIVLGSQATLPPVPATELKKHLEALGVPCFLAGMCRGLLGRKSPLHIRQHRSDALKEADVIILAGCVTDFRMGYGRKLNRRAKIIAINRDSKQLHLNDDMFWKATVSAQGDVGTFIQQLAGLAAGKTTFPETWLNMLQARDKIKETKNEAKGADKTEFINPIRLHQLLENRMDDNSIIVADGGDFVGTAAYILRPRGPLCWLDPGAFGTLGVGGGFALGAKLCRPDAEVWVIYGDGTVGYSIAEFDTFARHNVPIIAVVGNDACWTQIAREQVPMFNSGVACDLVRNDYHVVAQGYGGEGLVVSETDKLEETYTAAKAAAKAGKPVLINAYIGKTDFREGSISV